MSQGLAFVHTEGQCIDGYSENCSFAISVNPNFEKEISNSIETILSNYVISSREARMASKSFLWYEIATKYLNFYNSHE
jgi:hypothetical protein